MKDENDVIIKMNKIVNEYHSLNSIDGNTLNEMLRQITSCLYYLETVRSEAHNHFQCMIANLTEEGSSVAKANNLAHVAFPLMYKLRRIMTSGYEVVGAIRTNISYLKSEMNQNLN